MDNSSTLSEEISANRPLVAISCMAYNHEPYIRQCLDGFVIQNTNFPFVAIVHDDASTDGTAAIIKEYAEKYPYIIKPIYETENQYSKKDGSLDKIMSQAIFDTKCKYIAICEGDDYWTDPLKLQKQVDVLNSNPKYGLVYGKAKTWYEDKGYFGKSIGKKAKTFNEILRFNPIPTLTVLIRQDIYIQYFNDIKPYSKKWMMGDYPMWLYFSKVSNIYFLNEYLGVYRINKISASHFNSDIQHLQFQKNGLEIACYITNQFGIYSRITDIRLLWCNLKYAILTSDTDLLSKTQTEIQNARFWPFSLKLFILKIAYRHPITYIKLLKVLKTTLSKS